MKLSESVDNRGYLPSLLTVVLTRDLQLNVSTTAHQDLEPIHMISGIDKKLGEADATKLTDIKHRSAIQSVRGEDIFASYSARVSRLCSSELKSIRPLTAGNCSC